MTPETATSNNLVIVSNRLPVVAAQNGAGQVRLRPGSGGLVTALAPVLRNRGGTWIGWPGGTIADPIHYDLALARFSKPFGYALKAVELSAQDVELYYKGFANEIIWPLFHDFIARCRFNPAYWHRYVDVNRRFACAIVNRLEGQEFIWVHDYHLMNVGAELRKLGVGSNIAFFLHIPFPPPDIFMRLPWRFQILHALLAHDLIGFQTIRDRRNFIHCVRNLLKDGWVQGKGQVVGLRTGQRHLRVAALPISIDFHDFARSAQKPEVQAQQAHLKAKLVGQTIILGIDRLDYTKGIPERLEAFRAALSRYPDLVGRVTLVQVVVPSRRDIATYEALKVQIERLVGEINGQFTRPGWVPIHYLFRSLERWELLAFYRQADVALVTPLKDGMNLVAKEYCAANVDCQGVLILSEFAGAASQLQKYALMVNPHDQEAVASAIHLAVHMPAAQRRERMHRMRQALRRQDIFWWVDASLEAAISKKLNYFPLLEEYFPSERYEWLSQEATIDPAAAEQRPAAVAVPL